MTGTFTWEDALAGDIPETDDEMYALIDATPPIDRESPTEEVEAWVAVTDLGAVEAETIGAWVWLTFPGKPAAEVRDAIKAAGFIWNHKRGQWAHSCGVKSRRGGSRHPRTKYGSKRIKREDD